LPDSSSPELGGSYRHALKNLVIGPDDKLYVDIASSTNSDPRDTTSNPVAALSTSTTSMASMVPTAHFPGKLLIAPIGSWIPIIGIRIWIWIRESKPDEPETGAWEETVTNEETITTKEATASKKAVMETAVVERETTTA
jgi:glucose/arabinose dehydrogenase